MQRFVENEKCVDIEERVNGIWSVVRCSLKLMTSPASSFFKTAKVPQKRLHKNAKASQIKLVKERLTTKEFRDKKKLEYYGLTFDEYMGMISAQKNRCAICGEKQPLHINNGELNIDHDHNTGKVRGLLCNYCNTGIGMMKDNVVSMKNAIKYIEKSKKL